MSEGKTMEGPSTPVDYAGAGERLLKAGEPLVVYDTLADGLKHFPTDRRLRQLLALALARTGASRLANQLLLRLAHEGFEDEETLGLLALDTQGSRADSLDVHEHHYHLQQAFGRLP